MVSPETLDRRDVADQRFDLGRGPPPPPSASYPVGKHGAMTDHEHYAGVLNELNPQHRALRQMIPDVYEGFGELSRAALAAGAVESKVKELMAMVIGVVLGCDGCIASHARGAVRAGATKQEAAEMIGVSIMMHGGPATIYGARAYARFLRVR